MAAPIRSTVEIAAILNKGKNAIGDLGLDIIGDAKRGEDFSETSFRDKAYRLIFLRAYIKGIVDPSTGEINAYYSATVNEKKLNVMLDAIVQLCGTLGGPNSIPLIQGTRIPVVFYPSTSGTSSGGGGTGGTASPGGITFQNVSVSAPGEVVDSWDASANTFAFYLVEAIGSGVGEGSAFFVVSVSVRGSNTPVLTTYHSGGIGGSIAGVSFSAALNGGQLEFTANVPTDGWLVRGTRIQFENISFQNVLGPLPTGGTVGQYLRKSSSTDYDAAFAAIIISEITGLSTALASFLLLAGGTMTGAIAMGGFKITGAGAATTNGDLVRYEQLFGAFLALTGGTLSGALAMGGNKVTGAGAATTNGDLLRYEQLIGLYLLLTGGTMSGNIAMGGNKITGIGAATANGDAVQFEQLGGTVKTIVPITDWDIISSITKSVAHGLDASKIRSVTFLIRSDDGATIIPNNSLYALQNTPRIIQVTATDVSLSGTTALQTTDFDQTGGYIRGWITIESIP